MLRSPLFRRSGLHHNRPSSPSLNQPSRPQMQLHFPHGRYRLPRLTVGHSTPFELRLTAVPFTTGTSIVPAVPNYLALPSPT